MRVELAYGRDGLAVELPEERCTVVVPEFVPGLPEPDAALRRALAAPTAGPPLRELVRPGRTLAISVCDSTRPQPRAPMLQAIAGELAGIVRDEDVTILIATGTHRPTAADELVELLGPEASERFRVLDHDARDPSTLVDLGVLGDGVRVSLARAWVEADVRITTGFVEPHFFAGFSGGPKMVAPGLAGLDTTLTLHDARRIGHERATWGITVGNPVHDDIRAIAAATGVHFALDVLINSRKEITHVFAGELFAEHRAACETARRLAMRPLGAPYDVVLTTNSGYPLDRNLYQAVKGISAAALVARDGGTIVCAAECCDGVPEPYAELLRSGDSPAALLRRIETAPRTVPDQWQAQIQARIQARTRVLVRADGVPDDDLRAAHVEPVDDVAAAVLDAAGARGRICVLPEGPQTIPYLACGSGGGQSPPPPNDGTGSRLRWRGDG